MCLSQTTVISIVFNNFPWSPNSTLVKLITENYSANFGFVAKYANLSLPCQP